MNKTQVLDFISSKPHMVISTVNKGGKPESAVVGFGQTENLELIFGTSVNSRKAQNVLGNGNVSVVIGWDEQGTVQYEGKARMLEGNEVEKYSEIYFKKAPTARQHKDEPDERYFLISPTWLRHTNVQTTPWEVTEIQF